MEKNSPRTQSEQSRLNGIDVLPDDVLLEIFNFYVYKRPSFANQMEVEAWQSLVHVCRRWRTIVLGSPRRLNLRLYCTPKTPARNILDIWPGLPLIVEALKPKADTIAALEQSNRVCQVTLLNLSSRVLEHVLASMQVPFPELTVLQLSSHDETAPVIPDTFLGGYAPRLRSFNLYGILFPGMLDLFLSATRLISLSLFNIPHSGFISPEAMAALLSVLPSLESFSLKFRYPQPRPDPGLPSPKRFILPVLDGFYFTGVNEYLEDLVARIDAPRLEEMDISFFNQIVFDGPQLAQFINRSPTLRVRNEAHVQFGDFSATIALPGHSRDLNIGILCTEQNRQLSFFAQVCKPSFPPVLTVEDLYIERRLGLFLPIGNDDAIDHTLWLPLLRSFASVKNLYLSKEFGLSIAVTLEQEFVRGSTTELFPSLQNIFVEGLGLLGPFQEAIGQFVTSRQLSDRHVAISVWDRPKHEANVM